jgi:hypothetical protein
MSLLLPRLRGGGQRLYAPVPESVVFIRDVVGRVVREVVDCADPFAGPHHEPRTTSRWDRR